MNAYPFSELPVSRTSHHVVMFPASSVLNEVSVFESNHTAAFCITAGTDPGMTADEADSGHIFREPSATEMLAGHPCTIFEVGIVNSPLPVFSKVPLGATVRFSVSIESEATS